jgi:hypothetical protein
MATLAGQRAQFTYALNQYNQSDDPDTRTKFVRAMAKYIAAAPSNGFSVEQVTKGQTYPVAEVNEVIAANATEDPGITEEQAQRTVDEAVESSDVIRIGEGAAAVYAYGYRGYPDRLNRHSPDSGLLWARIARPDVLGNGRSRIACAASGRTS